MRPCATLILTGLSLLHICGDAAQLSGNDSSAAPGATLLLPVSLVTDGAAISGIQFDLDWDDPTLAVQLLPGDSVGATGKTFHFAALSTHSARLLIVGLNEQPFADGLLIRLFVFVRPSSPTGTATLMFSNVVATGPDGEPVPIGSLELHVAVDPGSTINQILTVDSVVNAASLAGRPVAPGEIISLFGPGKAMSPPLLQASDLSITLNGISAPILYVGDNQMNAVVPFGIESSSSAILEVLAQNQVRATAVLPIAPAQPGIFTQDATGLGPGAILNQDYTLNSYLNPADRGSVIMIYGTGLGQTNPPGIDGLVTNRISRSTLRVTAAVAGEDSQVLYAGSAPDLVAGVNQINIRIPADVAPGPAVPVILQAGNSASQAYVTVAVR